MVYPCSLAFIYVDDRCHQLSALGMREACNVIIFLDEPQTQNAVQNLAMKQMTQLDGMMVMIHEEISC